jgi:hypothetical protein
MSFPCVIAVILNTNRRDDTLECLESLYRNAYPNQRVIVLDNASSDGSAAAIRERFPQTILIELDRNLGYAGNNNVGIEAALQHGADWVFVLNEDTILAPDCIERLVSVGEEDARIGIVGPMVYHYDEPNVIQSAGGILEADFAALHIGQNEVDIGQYPEPRDVAWVSGCALLVRRKLIEEIGALDERFFYYWEETDWCTRARERGWRIVHIPQARLWHKGVQRNYQPSPNVTYYATRNRLLFLRKHHAPPKVWVLVWLQNLRTLFSWSVRPKWRASMREHRWAIRQGMMDFLRGRWGMRSQQG